MVTDWVRDALTAADGFILTYFILVNTSYLALIGLATAEFVQYRRRLPFAGADDTYRSPLTQPVTVLMPAYNEGLSIVAAVQAILSLRYPRLEAVVIDDGSTDDTFEQLRAAFDLVEIPRVVPDEVPALGTVRSVHVPSAGPDTLLVVRKDNGGKADALNVGINVAGSPLVCMVDADSILDPDALLAVAKPFTDDPLGVAATGGVVRIVNGCTILAGRVVEVRTPRTWLVRIQIVEYLRAFLLGRTGWSRLGGLVVISGAFALFRRDLLIEIGGLAHDCIGEDAEVVVRLHRHLREQRRPHRIVFVAEPVAWTEAPATGKVLARQRRRWHRGITEILVRHRGMLANPRYGRIGLLALPYYLVFELLAPVIELAGVVLIPLGVAVGAVDLDFAWRFILLAYGYAMLVSVVALALEEFAFHRYQRWRDLGAIFAAAILENLGYRQLTAWWRVQGMWAALRRRKAVWGVMTRTGFDAPPSMVGPTHPEQRNEPSIRG